MPIKLPKGFPRRKSSGNALEDSPNTSKHGSSESTSSFRVIPRPHSSAKSLDGGSTLRSMTDKPLPRPRTSFEEDSEDLFAAVRGDTANRYVNAGHDASGTMLLTVPSGSANTANSLSTAPYDSATSSTRYSNSSTNPSSVDSGSGRNVKPTGQRFYDEVSNNQRGGFLKSAGRTFSFGINRHNSKEASEPIPQHPPETNRRTTMTESRERTMTVSSSITTATPPRLDDSSFSIKESDDDFGNMFANLGSKPGGNVSRSSISLRVLGDARLLSEDRLTRCRTSTLDQPPESQQHAVSRHVLSIQTAILWQKVLLTPGRRQALKTGFQLPVALREQSYQPACNNQHSETWPQVLLFPMTWWRKTCSMTLPCDDRPNL